MIKSKNIRIFSGDIRQYQVNRENMTVQQKIDRLKELNYLEETANKKRSKRFTWILLPIIYAIFHFFAMSINFGGHFSPALRFCATFLLVFVSSLAFVPIVIPEKLEKKNVWKKWIVIVLTALAYTMFSSSYDVWFFTLLFISFMFLIIAIVYITLVGHGFLDIINYTQDEKQQITVEITDVIDRKKLTPIELQYDIVLGKDEIPLLETDAILLEVRERQPSPTGATAAHYLSTYTNALLRNVDFTKKSVSENIYNIKENLKNTNYKHVQPNRNYTQTVSNAPTANNNSQKSEFIGKFILTQKRVLFVGCPRGFQIFNKDLIAYGIDPANQKNITFQSEKSIRILSTDDNIWIKRYLDRIMKDTQLSQL